MEELANKKIASYCRVSSAEQKRGKTIEIQQEACREYVKSFGGKITEFYLDDGVSGAIADRPAWLDMIEDLSEYDAVVVYHPDRLSRDAGNTPIVKMVRQLWEHVDFWVIGMGKLEPGEHSETMLNMTGVMAHYERQRIITRSKAGKLHKAKRGLFVGHIPRYGYDYIHKTKDQPGYLKINAFEAKNVRRIYDIMLNGGTLGDVVREFDKKNIPPPGLKRGTKRGSKHWYRQAVWYMLQDQIYFGVYNYGRLKVVSKDGIRIGIVKTDESEWTPVKLSPELHIVTKPEWEAVQKRLKLNRVKNVAKQNYLLSGLIKCGNCGYTWSGAAFNRKGHYRCNNKTNRYPKPPTCRGVIRSDVVDGAVWNEIEKILDNPDMVLKMINEHNEKSRKQFKYQKNRYTDSQDRLDALLKEEARVKEAYRQGVYTLDTLKEELEKITNERNNFSEQAKPEPDVYEVNESQLRNWVEAIKDEAKNNFHYRKLLTQSIVEKVVMHKKEMLEISLNIPIAPCSELREVTDMAQCFRVEIVKFLPRMQKYITKRRVEEYLKEK